MGEAIIVKRGGEKFNFSGATGGSGQLLSGYKMWNNNGELVSGSMANRGAVTNALAPGQTYTIPAGYHNGGGKVTTSTAGATGAAAQLLSGYKMWNNANGLVTGTMTSRGTVSATIEPGGSYTIPGGWHSGSGKVTATAVNAYKMHTVIYTSNGIFNVPITGSYMVRIFGGGGAGSYHYAGSEYCGGGGGGWMNNGVISLTKGSQIQINIGIGGQSSGGNSGTGASGGTTTFGSYLSAAGGTGGGGGKAGSGGSGGGGSLGVDGGRGYQFGGGGGGGASYQLYYGRYDDESSKKFKVGAGGAGGTWGGGGGGGGGGYAVSSSSANGSGGAKGTYGGAGGSSGSSGARGTNTRGLGLDFEGDGIGGSSGTSGGRIQYAGHYAEGYPGGGGGGGYGGNGGNGANSFAGNSPGWFINFHGGTGGGGGGYGADAVGYGGAGYGDGGYGYAGGGYSNSGFGRGGTIDGSHSNTMFGSNGICIIQYYT